MRIFAALLSVLLAAPALAQVIPQTVPYQGYLTDQDGVPISGEVSLTFRIYAASQGGQARWEETHDGVTVNDGVFVVALGETDPIRGPLTANPGGYLAIQVEDDAEAEPRQKLGSVPYAFLAYDSQRLGGQAADEFVTNLSLEERNFLTREEILNLIQENGGGEGGITLDEVEAWLVENGYLTRAQILELIGDGQGITIDVLAQYLDDNGYVTFDALAIYLTENGYLTRDEIIALLDGYVTDAELAAALDGLVTDDELAAALADFVNADDLAAAVDGLVDADDLAAAVDGLVDADEVQAIVDQAVADAVANVQQGRRPYILGISNQQSNGRFSFNNVHGMEAATEMCRATYANEATAHMCTPAEANWAMSMSAWGDQPNFSNVIVWTNPAGKTADQTCQSLKYNSGDVATGTAMRLTLNHQSNGNGGGVTGHLFTLLENRGCGTSYRVLCCR